MTAHVVRRTRLRVSAVFRDSSEWWIVAIACIGTVVAAVLVVEAVAAKEYNTWALFWVAPVLFLVSLPALRREAARAGDRRLFWLLVTALALKFAFVAIRRLTEADVYGGGADSANYHDAGREIAAHLWSGSGISLDSLRGTDFIRFATGAMYSAIGVTRLGGFLIFAWLGFWGQFFFYRAFAIAVPEGRTRTYAHLIFFYPSLLYWTAATGKDAWMLFSIGLAAFGVARVLASGATWRGLAVAAGGLWLAVLVRPHVAAMAGVAFAVAYLLRPAPARLRELGPVVKGSALVVVAVMALLLVSDSEQFLKETGIDVESGTTASLGALESRTSLGGSQFQPAILDSPARAPTAIVTVLFRPFIFEAGNLQSIAVAAESTFLLLLTIIRFRWVWSAIRGARRMPYLAFALVFAGLFVFGFSAIANFGLLTRQRAQLLPLLFVLLSVPPRVRTDAGREIPSREERGDVPLFAIT